MRPLCVALAFATVLGACSGSGTSAQQPLPDARLVTGAGPRGPSLASCPTEKCLTVLVAPWCTVCHGAAGDIVALRRWLDARGVSSRVIVGASDDRSAIAEFGREFGPDALLDYDQVMHTRSVPLFLVSDRAGRVLKAVPGLPRVASSQELARYLELL